MPPIAEIFAALRQILPHTKTSNEPPSRIMSNMSTRQLKSSQPRDKFCTTPSRANLGMDVLRETCIEVSHVPHVIAFYHSGLGIHTCDMTHPSAIRVGHDSFLCVKTLVVMQPTPECIAFYHSGLGCITTRVSTHSNESCPTRMAEG